MAGTLVTELVVNLWAIYDEGAGVIYALSGRVYCLAGTDDEKLKVLRALSATDHVNAKRYAVPPRFQLVFSDGTAQRGVVYPNVVGDPNAQLFEDVFKELESELPAQPDFATETAAVPRKLPSDPLCVTTVLYEDEAGNIRPIISAADRAWAVEREKARGRTWPR